VDPGEALAILSAGAAAGGINAVVGCGSLITFPTLLAFGFPPAIANVSNNVGMVPGNVSGGLLGARYGRRLPPAVLRLFVVAVGVICAAKLIFF